MRLLLLVLVLTFGFAAQSGLADEPPVATFVDVEGKDYQLPGPSECKAVVLLFVGYDCPISNSYAKEIVRLDQEFQPKAIHFCLVYADADITREQAQKHTHDFGYTCPAILDPKMILARKYGATIKPEVAVLSPKGELLYRGRIDDRYIDYTRRRAQLTSRDLRDTLAALIADKPIPAARTTAVGCDIYFPKSPK